MSKRAFGDLENSILYALRSGKRASVRDVQTRLGGQDKYTTIMTVMSRLVDKGLLERERVGTRHEYWIVQKETTSLLERARSKLFGMKTAEVVSYLINQADDLSDTDLDMFEMLIADAKNQRAQGESE